MTATFPQFDIMCIHCLQNKGRANALCPHCGYDEHKHQNHPLYLKPRTLLKNQYMVGQVLGQGGFGITYVGFDQWLQKKVAIKEYLPSALATRDFLTSFILPLKKHEDAFNHGLQLFINEARHLAKFDHPHIVRVINFFEENQTGYMVMDYLAGDSPEYILAQQGGRLPAAAAVAILLPILEALTEIHSHHLYHCDISAQNIRILPTGGPILIDFGAARHIVGEQSRTLDLVLKHGYSPLEQYSGKGKIGPWTDIYACGALLYLMVTGSLPPAATDRFCEDTLTAPVEITGVNISVNLSQVIMQALAIRLEERFQTVSEFKVALEGPTQASLKTVHFTPLVKTEPSVVAKKSRPLIWVMGIFLSIGLVTFLIWIKENLLPPVTAPLLKQAETQWTGGKWVTPVGDNAYETYQHILQIAPDNVEAQAGIMKVADHFYQVAQQALEKSNLTDSLKQVKQGLQVAPRHVKLLSLEKELLTSLAEQQRAQQVSQLLDQAAHHLAKLELTETVTVYQEVLKIDPPNPSAQTGLQQVAEKYERLATQPGEDVTNRLAWVAKGLAAVPLHQGLLSLKRVLEEKRVASQREKEEKLAKQRHLSNLLNQAPQQLQALHLTEPAGDNAYETYQQVLKLVPDNQEANRGLVQIADEYERLARIKRESLQNNLALIDKGLDVSPTHAGLLALRHTLTQPKPVVKQAPPWPVPREPSLSGDKMPPRTVVPSVPKEVQPTASSSSVVTVETIPKPRDKQISSEKPPVAKFNPEKTSPLPTATSQFSATEDKLYKKLILAKQLLEEQQLEKAVETYQQVLKEAPDNREARLGLQQVTRTYEQLARQQVQQQNWSQSLSFIDKGLTTSPGDVSLLSLQQEVNRLRQEKTPPPPPKEAKPSSNIIFTPSF